MASVVIGVIPTDSTLDPPFGLGSPPCPRPQPPEPTAPSEAGGGGEEGDEDGGSASLDPDQYEADTDTPAVCAPDRRWRGPNRLAAHGGQKVAPNEAPAKPFKAQKIDSLATRASRISFLFARPSSLIPPGGGDPP